MSGKNYINIEGIKLGKEAIRRIKVLQDFDNEGIKAYEKQLSDALMFLIRNKDDFSADQIEKHEGIVYSLIFIRDFIETLRADGE